MRLGGRYEIRDGERVPVEGPAKKAADEAPQKPPRAKPTPAKKGG